MINRRKHIIVFCLIAFLFICNSSQKLFAQTLVGTKIDNIGNLRYNFADGVDDSTMSNTVSVEVAGKSAFGISKNVFPLSAAVGDTIYYTISIADTGNIPLSNVVVTDTIPNSLSVISVSKGLITGNSFIWNTSSLNAGSVDSVIIAAVITQPLAVGSIVTNYCYGIDDAGTRISTYAEFTVRSRPIPQIDEIEINKTASKQSVLGGDTVIYTIRLNNTGNTTLRYVTMKDTLQSDLIFVGVTSNASFSNNVVSYLRDSIMIGETDSVSVTTIMKADGVGDRNIWNRAYVQTDKTGLQFSEVDIYLQPAPDIDFIKQGPSSANVIDTISYTIYYSNNSSSVLHDVQITDTLDPLMKPIDYSGGLYDSINHRITWSIPTIDPQVAGLLSVRVVINDTLSDNRIVRNSAGFISREVGSKKSSVETHLYIPAHLRIWKNVSNQKANPGDTLQYQITVSNISIVSADSITISDQLPEELLYVSASPACVYDEQTRTVVWHEDSLNASAIKFYTITARVKPDIRCGERNIINVALAKWSTGEASSSDDANSNASVNLVVPFLQVTKQAVRRIVEVGDVAHYAIRITNLSNETSAHDITVEDNIPLGFKYIAGSSFNEKENILDPTINHRELIWHLADSISPKGSVQLTYRLVVGAGALDGDGINKAQAIGKTPAGITISSDIAQERVEIKKGIFTDRGFVIGKVFYDDNENYYQDAGEEGVKGVELMTEEGTRVVTGDGGKYSLPDMNAGEHVLRVRQETLPQGDELVCGYSDFGNNPSSRFVHLTESGIARVDFYVRRGKISPIQLTQDIASIGTLEAKRIVEPKNIVFRHEEGLSPIQIKGTQFEIGKAKLKPEAYPTLKAVADLAKEFVDQIIAVSGHTDSMPIKTKEFPSNKELSLARANAVKNYLIENYNIDSARFSVVGFAETQPVATNSTKSGRALNRRVEIEMGKSSDPFASYMKTVQFKIPIHYSGPVKIKSISIEDRLDTLFHYVEGSGMFGNNRTDPVINKDRLIFKIDSVGNEINNTLTYRTNINVQTEKIKSAISSSSIKYFTRDSVVMVPDVVSTTNNIARTTRSKPVTFTLSGVLFDIGKATLKEEVMNAMKSAAEMLKTYPQATAVVEGHTDSKPIKTKEFPSNVALSNARAVTVMNALSEEFGIDRSRLQSYGWGELKPVASNSTDDGRRANRRVEIKIYKEELNEQSIQEGFEDSSSVISRMVDAEYRSVDYDSSSDSVSGSRFYLLLEANRQKDKQTISTWIADTLDEGLNFIPEAVDSYRGIDTFWIEKNILIAKCNEADSVHSLYLKIEMNNKKSSPDEIDHSFVTIRKLKNGKEAIDRSKRVVIRKSKMDR